MSALAHITNSGEENACMKCLSVFTGSGVVLIALGATGQTSSRAGDIALIVAGALITAIGSFLLLAQACGSQEGSHARPPYQAFALNTENNLTRSLSVASTAMTDSEGHTPAV